MKKQIFSSVLLFIIIASICGTLFNNSDSYSQIENRYLSEFELSKADDYLTDYFPLRTSFISFKNKLEYVLGKRLINGVYVGKNKYLIPENVDYDKKEYIVEAINNYSKDKNVVTMIIPDSISVNKKKLPFSLTGSQEDDLYYFADCLNTENINILNALIKQNDLSNDLYYRSDHHWTSNGAYIAYKEFCEALGLDVDDNYEIKTVSDDFLGTSASLAIGLASKDSINIYEYDNDLTVEYFDSKEKKNSLYNFDHLDSKDQYSLFLDGNHSLIKITNNDLLDGSIVVIKNSYANCFIPFIVNNYREVYVVDLRYYNDSVSSLVEENEIENSLIMYNLNNLYTDLSIIKLK